MGFIKYSKCATIFGTKLHFSSVPHSSHSIRHIEWIFPAAKSSHLSGAVEIIVKIFKTALRTAIGRQKLTYETLEVFCFECEMVCNSRPLYTVRSNGDHIVPITPSELACGRVLQELPAPVMSNEENISFPAQWKMRRMLQNGFWRNFSDNYLRYLIPTKKSWTSENLTPIKPKDVVLLKDTNLSKNNYKLAVVDKIITGTDGRVRTTWVTPVNAKNSVHRHISKLCLLEAFH